MVVQTLKPTNVNEQTWEDFKTLRKAKKAPITETALAGIEREARKAGITLEEALKECCAMGWQGFKALWHARSCKVVRGSMTYAEIDRMRSIEKWEQMTGTVHPDRVIADSMIVDSCIEVH